MNNAKTKIIFHLPWKLSERQSASQIRPKEMLYAFQSLGFDIIVVSGNNKERHETIKFIKQDIKKGTKYQFCYSESSTLPTLLASGKKGIFMHFGIDYKFFAMLKKYNIPLGLFLRDIYWRFADFKKQFVHKNNILKYFLFVCCYWLDVLIYNKYITVLYIPSIRMLTYLPYNLQTKKYLPLPSGTHDRITISSKAEPLKFIYTGGIGNHYEMSILFEVASCLQKAEYYFCFRKDEWDQEKDKYEKYLTHNIHIVHYQSKELVDLYNRCHIGIIFCKPIIYWKFAMPFKLFDYLSYKLPIISVEDTSTGDFIKQWDVGWVLPYNAEALKTLFLYLANNPQEISRAIANIDSIIKDNLWTTRAISVNNSLCIS
jgi:hypothetical protein